MEDKNKESQLKEEAAEKVSGGHFEPMYGAAYPAEQVKNLTVPWLVSSSADDDIGGGD